ncbi:hypothetical protein [Spirochaeta cellobiosiphila]|uniref:hypothetical protein n=1 Tax=Spirochaeta cellobiosiphila TaxID=504483 RepID=UPI0003F59FEE|nr:hypothetical protein [Spirochaeta cellobiosiphila]
MMNNVENRAKVINTIYDDVETGADEGFILSLYTQVNDIAELKGYMVSSFGLSSDTGVDQLIEEALNAFENNKIKIYDAIKKYINEDLESDLALIAGVDSYDPEDYKDISLDNLDDAGRFIIGVILLKDTSESLKYCAFLLTVVMKF